MVQVKLENVSESRFQLGENRLSLSVWVSFTLSENISKVNFLFEGRLGGTNIHHLQKSVEILRLCHLFHFGNQRQSFLPVFTDY
jgi:hypothetical protein